MPTVLDATVVNSAYDTSGNGGRKLVSLKSGNQYAAVRNGTTDFRIYKSTDKWATPGTLFYTGVFNTTDIALATDGKFVFAVFSIGTGTQVGTRVLDEAGSVISSTTIDVNQSALGNVSLAINEAGTELHAAWASKNSTYPNSFNIRYAKGTINADGSVTWGAVEQWTTHNTSGADNKNPSILFAGNKPIVIYENGSSPYSIIAMSTSGMANAPVGSLTKPYTVIYSVSTYAQSSPSAIFLPQSVNGLANGRIWVAWVGHDSVDTNIWGVKVSYSDDGGATWSAMQKITTGGTSANGASITANKNNEVFIVWGGWTTSLFLRKIKFSNGSWGAITDISPSGTTTAAYSNPSTLFDLSVNFTEPLFVYKGNAKVGFYGTWTVTTISVTPGDIGQKSDKANLLSYSITTDGTMSTITEKVNGVTIGTKNATSGQPLIAGLTQAQWDAIRFGKYADATGGKNTLTIEMGSEKWTYTFDKRPATDADIISAVKAVKDSQEVYLPAVKAKLASAVRSKGGSVSDDAALEAVAQAVEGMSVPKKASGTATSSSSGGNFLTASGSSTTAYYVAIDMTVLGFIPKVVTLYRTDKTGIGMTVWLHDNFLQNGSSIANVEVNGSDLRAPYVNGITNIPVIAGSTSFTWDAFE